MAPSSGDSIRRRLEAELSKRVTCPQQLARALATLRQGDCSISSKQLKHDESRGHPTPWFELQQRLLRTKPGPEKDQLMAEARTAWLRNLLVGARKAFGMEQLQTDKLARDPRAPLQRLLRYTAHWLYHHILQHAWQQDQGPYQQGLSMTEPFFQLLPPHQQLQLVGEVLGALCHSSEEEEPIPLLDTFPHTAALLSLLQLAGYLVQQELASCSPPPTDGSKQSSKSNPGSNGVSAHEAGGAQGQEQLGSLLAAPHNQPMVLVGRLLQNRLPCVDSTTTLVPVIMASPACLVRSLRCLQHHLWGTNLALATMYQQQPSKHTQDAWVGFATGVLHSSNPLQQLLAAGTAGAAGGSTPVLDALLQEELLQLVAAVHPLLAGPAAAHGGAGAQPAAGPGAAAPQQLRQQHRGLEQALKKMHMQPTWRAHNELLQQVLNVSSCSWEAAVLQAAAGEGGGGEQLVGGGLGGGRCHSSGSDDAGSLPRDQQQQQAGAGGAAATKVPVDAAAAAPCAGSGAVLGEAGDAVGDHTSGHPFVGAVRVLLAALVARVQLQQQRVNTGDIVPFFTHQLSLAKLPVVAAAEHLVEAARQLAALEIQARQLQQRTAQASGDQGAAKGPPSASGGGPVSSTGGPAAAAAAADAQLQRQQQQQRHKQLLCGRHALKAAQQQLHAQMGRLRLQVAAVEQFLASKHVSVFLNRAILPYKDAFALEARRLYPDLNTHTTEALGLGLLSIGEWLTSGDDLPPSLDLQMKQAHVLLAQWIKVLPALLRQQLAPRAQAGPAAVPSVTAAAAGRRRQMQDLLARQPLAALLDQEQQKNQRLLLQRQHMVRDLLTLEQQLLQQLQLPARGLLGPGELQLVQQRLQQLREVKQQMAAEAKAAGTAAAAAEQWEAVGALLQQLVQDGLLGDEALQLEEQLPLEALQPGLAWQLVQQQQQQPQVQQQLHQLQVQQQLQQLSLEGVAPQPAAAVDEVRRQPGVEELVAQLLKTLTPGQQLGVGGGAAAATAADNAAMQAQLQQLIAQLSVSPQDMLLPPGVTPGSSSSHSGSSSLRPQGPPPGLDQVVGPAPSLPRLQVARAGGGPASFSSSSPGAGTTPGSGGSRSPALAQLQVMLEHELAALTEEGGDVQKAMAVAPMMLHAIRSSAVVHCLQQPATSPRDPRLDRLTVLTAQYAQQLRKAFREHGRDPSILLATSLRGGDKSLHQQLLEVEAGGEEQAGAWVRLLLSSASQVSPQLRWGAQAVLQAMDLPAPAFATSSSGNDVVSSSAAHAGPQQVVDEVAAVAAAMDLLRLRGGAPSASSSSSPRSSSSGGGGSPGSSPYSCHYDGAEGASGRAQAPVAQLLCLRLSGGVPSETGGSTPSSSPVQHHQSQPRQQQQQQRSVVRSQPGGAAATQHFQLQLWAANMVGPELHWPQQLLRLVQDATVLLTQGNLAAAQQLSSEVGPLLGHMDEEAVVAAHEQLLTSTFMQFEEEYALPPAHWEQLQTWWRGLDALHRLVLLQGVVQRQQQHRQQQRTSTSSASSDSESIPPLLLLELWQASCSSRVSSSEEDLVNTVGAGWRSLEQLPGWEGADGAGLLLQGAGVQLLVYSQVQQLLAVAAAPVVEVWARDPGGYVGALPGNMAESGVLLWMARLFMASTLLQGCSVLALRLLSLAQLPPGHTEAAAAAAEEHCVRCLRGATPTGSPLQPPPAAWWHQWFTVLALYMRCCLQSGMHLQGLGQQQERQLQIYVQQQLQPRLLPFLHHVAAEHGLQLRPDDEGEHEAGTDSGSENAAPSAVGDGEGEGSGSWQEVDEYEEQFEGDTEEFEEATEDTEDVEQPPSRRLLLLPSPLADGAGGRTQQSQQHKRASVAAERAWLALQQQQQEGRLDSSAAEELLHHAAAAGVGLGSPGISSSMDWVLGGRARTEQLVRAGELSASPGMRRGFLLPGQQSPREQQDQQVSPRLQQQQQGPASPTAANSSPAGPSRNHKQQQQQQQQQESPSPSPSRSPDEPWEPLAAWLADHGVDKEVPEGGWGGNMALLHERVGASICLLSSEAAQLVHLLKPLGPRQVAAVDRLLQAHGEHLSQLRLGPAPGCDTADYQELPLPDAASGTKLVGNYAPVLGDQAAYLQQLAMNLLDRLPEVEALTELVAAHPPKPGTIGGVGDKVPVEKVLGKSGVQLFLGWSHGVAVLYLALRRTAGPRFLRELQARQRRTQGVLKALQQLQAAWGATSALQGDPPPQRLPAAAARVEATVTQVFEHQRQMLEAARQLVSGLGLFVGTLLHHGFLLQLRIFRAKHVSSVDLRRPILDAVNAANRQQVWYLARHRLLVVPRGWSREQLREATHVEDLPKEKMMSWFCGQLHPWHWLTCRAATSSFLAPKASLHSTPNTTTTISSSGGVKAIDALHPPRNGHHVLPPDSASWGSYTTCCSSAELGGSRRGQGSSSGGSSGPWDAEVRGLLRPRRMRRELREERGLQLEEVVGEVVEVQQAACCRLQLEADKAADVAAVFHQTEEAAQVSAALAATAAPPAAAGGGGGGGVPPAAHWGALVQLMEGPDTEALPPLPFITPHHTTLPGDGLVPQVHPPALPPPESAHLLLQTTHWLAALLRAVLGATESSTAQHAQQLLKLLSEGDAAEQQQPQQLLALQAGCSYRELWWQLLHRLKPDAAPEYIAWAASATHGTAAGPAGGGGAQQVVACHSQQLWGGAECQCG